MNKPRQPWFLKLIILQLFIKGMLLLPLSVGLFTLLGKDLGSLARTLFHDLGLDVDNYYIDLFLTKLGLAKTTILVEISIGLFLYGSLCLVEAYGLHKRRRWAEYLTVTVISLLIPFELLEVFKNFSSIMAGVLALNIAIVYYLVRHTELFPKKTAPTTK